MNRRSVLTLSTAAALGGLYALYSILFSPWLTPRDELFAQRRVRSGEIPLHDPESKRQAQEHLADQPWVLEADYQLRTGNSFVFARDWKKLEDVRRVRFTPFAMIWRPDKKDGKPLTIVSDSAVVTFAREVVLTNFHSSPGRVVGGALEGNVRIRGEDGLAVDGQNFNFSEEAKRVWSDHPLTFAHKTNSGSAAGLELDLIPKTGPPDDDGPAVSGVRTVRLRKDVKLNIERAEPGREPERVRVTCSGTLEYGVETHVAEFRQDVRVARKTAENQFDRLKTEVLTLVFEPKPKTAENAAGEQAEKAPSDGSMTSLGGDLDFRRMRAEGPGTSVLSERSDLQADMYELTYDEASRVVALRDAKQVHLVQQNSELFCPEVTATLAADGSLDHTVCRGAGRIFRYLKTAAPAAKAADRPVEFAGQWQTQLELGPDEDPESGLDLIALTGRATLSQPNRMALRADLVKLWVSPIRKKDGLRSGPETERLEENTRPKRMLAVGSADFASPQITGRTERLEVWFEDGPLPEPPPDGSAESAVRQRTLRPPAATLIGRTDAQGAAPPAVRRNPNVRQAGPGSGGAAPAGAYASVDDPKPPGARRTPRGEGRAAKADEKPPHLTANRIRVKTMMDGDDPQIAVVIADGNVHVVQERRPDEKPFDLQGDRLRLENYSERHQVLRLQGEATSAQISDRQLQLEGRDIHFDRGRNKARVVGAGRLRLPVTKNPFDDTPVTSNQQLDVFWTEEMTFDGETATFLKDVHTQLGDSEVRCEEMQVTLDQRIDFADDGQRSQNTEVRTVLCRDGVHMVSRTYVGNILNEKRQASGFEFLFDKTTGDTTAQGPGHVLLWRRGSGNRAALGAKQSVVANRPRGEPETPEWEYSRIDFAGRMQGNAQRNHTEFHQRVKIVNGPVGSSTAVVDKDKLPRLGGWMTCRQLELTQERPEGNDAYLVAVGRGNVSLEGQTEQGLFHANAETITYDESKGLYTLHGDGRRDATLSREKRPGAGTGGDWSAQVMQFIPAQNFVKIDRSPGGRVSP